MKKVLVSVLTATAFMGSAGTGFAAENPFTDVPKDHWAYDAAAQLAADGIIEGYGDGTYRGGQKLTRFEMAQMVARAMAKHPTGADKALVDKLAAEYAEELGSLGVRVTELERKVDNLTWKGELRYRYLSSRDKNSDGGTDKTNVERLQFRLYPTAVVNDHWKLKGRMQATLKPKEATNATGVTMAYFYADGDYGKFNINFGRMLSYSENDEGLITDDFFNGVRVTYGRELRVILEAGRWNINEGGNDNIIEAPGAKDDPASYQGLQLIYEKDKVFAGLGYRHFNSDMFKTAVGYNKGTELRDDASIWSGALRYTFDKNWAAVASYAVNTKADSYKKSGSLQLEYKGAKLAEPGSWGAFAAYRHLGSNVSLMPTYDTAHGHLNEKGWDLGVDYVFMENMLLKLGYFQGKNFEKDKKAQTLFGRVSIYF